jgi:muramidase (phage lysozyme)
MAMLSFSMAFTWSRIEDSGSSIAKGLEEEAAFFAKTDPWNSLFANDNNNNKLGIPALRNTLANVLLQVMKASLPDILDEIDEQFQAIDKAVEAWGEMLLTKSEQRKFYHSLTQRLIANVSANLSGKGPRGRNNGTSNKPAGAARLHTACNEFLKKIKNGSLATISQLQEGSPVLVSTTNTAEDVRGEIVHIDLEQQFVCVDYVDDKDHTTDILFDAVGYSTENPDFEKDEVWSDGHRVFIGRESGLFDSMRKLPLNHVRTDPAWLIEKIAEYRTDDLACFINVEMFRNIVGEFVHSDWTPPCLELLKNLETILHDALDQALQESFRQEVTRYPMLKSMMEERCREACSALLDDSTKDVKANLEIEENHPYTQDEVLLQTLSESRFQNLRRDLEIQLKLAQEGVVFDTQAITSILDTVFNKHKKLHWMAEQMELVLSSYGKVATQRVLDRTPQICWQTCRKLPGSLQESLGGVTDDILEKCLWESPESKEKYQDMVSTLKDLQEAMEVVKNIQ